MQYGYNFTRKWLNCTLLRLVKLPRRLLMKLYQYYTQKHVITYTYFTLTRVIGVRAQRVRHPLLLPIGKKMFGRKYIKTTMRMLTILREAEEWTCVHLREACLLFVSAIKKCSLYLRQNDKAQAKQTRRRKYVYQTRMA